MTLYALSRHREEHSTFKQFPSAYRGKPENICSGRGFRLLTPIGHFTKSANGDWDALRRRAGPQAMMRAVNAAVIGQAIWGVTRTLHPDRERYRRGEAFGCQKKRSQQISGT
jgi:hypothetical protein